MEKGELSGKFHKTVATGITTFVLATGAAAAATPAGFDPAMDARRTEVIERYTQYMEQAQIRYLERQAQCINTYGSRYQRGALNLTRGGLYTMINAQADGKKCLDHARETTDRSISSASKSMLSNLESIQRHEAALQNKNKPKL